MCIIGKGRVEEQKLVGTYYYYELGGGTGPAGRYTVAESDM